MRATESQPQRSGDRSQSPDRDGIIDGYRTLLEELAIWDLFSEGSFAIAALPIAGSLLVFLSRRQIP